MDSPDRPTGRRRRRRSASRPTGATGARRACSYVSRLRPSAPAPPRARRSRSFRRLPLRGRHGIPPSTSGVSSIGRRHDEPRQRLQRPARTARVARPGRPRGCARAPGRRAARTRSAARRRRTGFGLRRRRKELAERLLDDQAAQPRRRAPRRARAARRRCAPPRPARARRRTSGPTPSTTGCRWRPRPVRPRRHARERRAGTPARRRSKRCSTAARDQLGLGRKVMELRPARQARPPGDLRRWWSAHSPGRAGTRSSRRAAAPRVDDRRSACVLRGRSASTAWVTGGDLPDQRKIQSSLNVTYTPVAELAENQDRACWRKNSRMRCVPSAGQR